MTEITKAVALDETAINMAVSLEKMASGQSSDTDSWANASDARIREIIQMADAGTADLTQDFGWTVGDERKIYYPEVGRFMTVVLTDPGFYELTIPLQSGRTTCHFVCVVKNCYYETKPARNDSEDFSNAYYDGCDLDVWLNTDFYNELPSGLRSSLKQFKFKVATHTYVSGDSGDTVKTLSRYVTVPAEKEVLGSYTYSHSTEAAECNQLDYYTVPSHRLLEDVPIIDSSVTYYWLRSPIGNSSYASGRSWFLTAISTNQAHQSSYNVRSVVAQAYVRPIFCI